MTDDIQFLEWDSKFFQFNVWKFNKKEFDTAELNTHLHHLNHPDARLIYYSSEKELKNLDHITNPYSIRLVDRKTTYLKRHLEHYPVTSIAPYNEPSPDSQLIELAIQSGEYSRFAVDPDIPEYQFRELYTHWIVNSVNRTIAKQVLVYRKNNQILGFITLGEQNGRGDIGLIAVSAKFRGTGIGKALMRAAENWFAGNHYSSIQVTTQESNIPARRLYESCQYEPERIEYYYHIWKNT